MTLKAFGTAFVVLALTACSSRPTEPSRSVPVPAMSALTAAAKPASAAMGATAAAAALAPTANGETPVLNRRLISAGYKATSIKGEVYYCRTVDVTNTAFKRKVCLNEAQLRDEERKTKELQERMLRQQWSPACTPFPSCAG